VVVNANINGEEFNPDEFFDGFDDFMNDFDFEQPEQFMDQFFQEQEEMMRQFEME